MDLHTGHPLSSLSGFTPPSYPKLAANHECDVLILGGGITGALVAHSLIGSNKQTVLIEGRQIGRGSTIASTSLLSHAVDTHLKDLAGRYGLASAASVYRAGLDAVDRIAQVTMGLGDDCGFQRKNSLYLASSEQDAVELRDECALRVKAGLPAEYWDRSTVGKRCAFEAPGAIWSAGEGQIDAFRLTHAALKAAAADGIKVFERTCAASVVPDAGEFHVETTGGHQVRARELVLATGYESQSYLRTRCASYMSTFAIASEPAAAIDGWPEDCLIWETARPYLYLRRTAAGRVLVGGEDEPGRLAHADHQLLKTKTAQLEKRFIAMFRNATFETYCAWGGTFVESPDGLPYISQHEDLPGAWFALGYGGNGITFAVVAAQIIAASILGERPPQASMYSFQRPSA